MYPAKQSPRTCDDGTLRWYCGDTFSILFNFIFKDASGYPIQPQSTDTINIIFKNEKNQTVKSYSATGSSTVEVDMDATTTVLFPEGVYSIEAKYNGEYVTTLLHNTKVVVE